MVTSTGGLFSTGVMAATHSKLSVMTKGREKRLTEDILENFGELRDCGRPKRRDKYFVLDEFQVSCAGRARRLTDAIYFVGLWES